MQKRALVIGIFILFSFFIVGFVSSLGMCSVRTSQQCSDEGWHAIMRISSLENAHASTIGETDYNDYVLCCDYGSGDLSCDDDLENRILGLSSSNNAHAEIPENSNYGVNICYEGVRCRGTMESCLDIGPGYDEFIRISGNTNAHLGRADSDYAKICCINVEGVNCGLNAADWSVSSVPGNSGVDMIIYGDTLCEGAQIAFRVFDSNDNQVGNTKYKNFGSGNVLEMEWVAQYISGGDNEYYFVAYVEGSRTEESQTSESLLTVTEPPECPSGISLCSHYLDSDLCSADPCRVGGNSCGPETSNCMCLWDSHENACRSVSEVSTSCGNNVINIGETCDGIWNSGNEEWDSFEFGASLTCLDFDDFEGGTLNCNPPFSENECQIDTSQCTIQGEPSPPGVCGDGEIQTGEQCDGTDWGPIEGCSDLGFEGGTLSCSSNCLFDTSECTGEEIELGEGPVDPPSGRCIYETQTDDDCDDGFLTYSWTATWISTNGVPQPTWCSSGSRVVECPAQIELPFFEAYNLITAIVLISLIYAVMIILKKKKIRFKLK